MAASDPRPIIVRKKKAAAHGHHGGAWKIAYADFVTAMMAFFLLMWLLGSVDGGKLKGISEFFKNPVKTSLAGGSSIGESNILLNGGGQDLTAEAGLVKKVLEERERERAESESMRSVKKDLEDLIESNATLRPFKKQLLIDLTTEGLRIQIVDEQSRPMFELARAELQPYTKAILRELAPTISRLPNRISLSGHTDASPYAGGEKSYSNWELSSERANAARRELVRGGLADGRMIRVIGLSSSVLLQPDQPSNPVNRRISIILLNQKAERAAANEGRIPVIETGAVQPPADPTSARPSKAGSSSP